MQSRTAPSTALITTLLFLAVANTPVGAQSTIALSLAEAIRRAEATAPSLAEARARQAAADAVLGRIASAGAQAGALLQAYNPAQPGYLALKARGRL